MMERQNDTKSDIVLVLTTFADEDKARHIGTRIVELQLAACINIIPGLESIYQWKGDLEVEGECLCLLKTMRAKLEALEEWIQENHPYGEPEFMVISAEAGSKGYLDWVRRQLVGG